MKQIDELDAQKRRVCRQQSQNDGGAGKISEPGYGEVLGGGDFSDCLRMRFPSCRFPLRYNESDNTVEQRLE